MTAAWTRARRRCAAVEKGDWNPARSPSGREPAAEGPGPPSFSLLFDLESGCFVTPIRPSSTSHKPVDPFHGPFVRVARTRADLKSAYESGDLAHAERIRERNLDHEASIKSLGLVHYLVAVALGLLALREASSGPAVPGRGAELSLYGGAAAVCVGLGYGLRRLHLWAKRVEIALAAAGVLIVLARTVVMFVTGVRVAAAALNVAAALLCFYGLYLLLSAKGRMVFSPLYEVVVEKTPHLKARMNRSDKIVLTLLSTLLGAAMIALFVGGPK